jgi:hypothetical protein
MKNKEKIRIETDCLGAKRYCNKNGQLHRLDGPAIEYPDGYKAWYQNGKPYRLNGPAIEYSDGSKSWYQDGQLHRLDGPAVECSDGTRLWYFKGEGPLHPLEWLKLIGENKDGTN